MVDQGAIWKVGYEDVPAQVYPIGSLVYTEFSEKFCKSTSFFLLFFFTIAKISILSCCVKYLFIQKMKLIFFHILFWYRQYRFCMI